MRIFPTKNPNILKAFNDAKKWVETNTVESGISHNSQITSLYIPTLLKWGERERALQYADWLLSCQTAEGAWNAPDSSAICVLTTARILKSLHELTSTNMKYEQAFLQGCDWLIEQIDGDGHICSLTPSDRLKTDPYIYLCLLDSLTLAAKKNHKPTYDNVVSTLTQHYIDQRDWEDVYATSRFCCDAVITLIHLGYKDKALTLFKRLETLHRFDDAIPNFLNTKQVCITSLFQWALCCYTLDLLEQGDRFFNYALSKQNNSGGFSNGYGWFGFYFKNSAVHDGVKYFLDALSLKLKREFSVKSRAERFLPRIDPEDERYQHLLSILNKILLKDNSDVTLLDVGTGKGRYIHPLLHSYPQVTITAMDIADTLFSYLPEKCHKAVGSICQLPFEDNQFDLVFCAETLEHALNIEGAVKELARVCKPNGYVIIIDKDLSRPANIKLEAWEQWFDKDALKQLMIKATLDVDVKTLTTKDGPPICCWTGLKKSLLI